MKEAKNIKTKNSKFPVTILKAKGYEQARIIDV